MKLAKARLAASKARDELDQGIDPGTAKVAEKVAERTTESIEDLAKEYLERHARKKKRSAAQDERTLNVEVIPRWRNKKAKSITARDVVLLLDEIEKRDAPVMRNRTHPCYLNCSDLGSPAAFSTPRLPLASNDSPSNLATTSTSSMKSALYGMGLMMPTSIAAPPSQSNSRL